MRTTYLTSLTAAFNPLSTTGIVPRLFLTLLPAAAHKSIQIKTTQLPRNSPLPASLELGFKDGKKLKYTWAERAKTAEVANVAQEKPVALQDIVDEVDRHARIAGRKEDLAG